MIPGELIGEAKKDNLPGTLVIYNLCKYLYNPVDRYCGNTIGAILKRFIKPISSEMLGHLEKSIYGPGPSTAVPGLHYDFFNNDFGIWTGNISDGCYIPISMNKVYRVLVLSQHIV